MHHYNCTNSQYNNITFDVNTYHSGDETSWTFEVFYRKAMIGEGNNFKTEALAIAAAKTFCHYFVI